MKNLLPVCTYYPSVLYNFLLSLEVPSDYQGPRNPFLLRLETPGPLRLETAGTNFETNILKLRWLLSKKKKSKQYNYFWWRNPLKALQCFWVDSKPVADAASDGDLFLRYSSLRLPFLLIVDGLFLLFILVGEGALPSLVSREQVKVELIVTEKLNYLPWRTSAWHSFWSLNGVCLRRSPCPPCCQERRWRWSRWWRRIWTTCLDILALGIPSDRWMGYAFEGRLALPGVQRAGEGGADGDGEIELLALTY